MMIRSLGDLVHQIRDLTRPLVGVDGYHGVGKSTLARTISTLLEIRCVHLDAFVNANEGSFVQSLRFRELSDVLCERPLIVEGVCLLDVLERLHVKPDLLIYVEGVEPDPRTRRGSGLLAREVREYHKKRRPFDSADVVYTLSNGGDPVNPTRIDVEVAFIQAQTKLAMVLAVGGMLSLLVGLSVLLFGVTGQDHTLLKAAAFEVSASGRGGIIMTTSVMWAVFAYKCRPMFSQRSGFSEDYDSKGRIVGRRERSSSTQLTVEPKE
jgi:hypothetical protein